ncbi:MAG: hypothetical protein QOK35_763 [Pseudonocardiales bacterium]|nr:hypothetical protein [Pseudonocardiales bacterium]
MREDLERVVLEYVESFNDYDLERLGTVLAPEVEYSGFGDQARGTGRESFLAMVEQVKAADAETRGSLRRMVLDAEANVAVAFVDVRRSDPELPTLRVTTLLTVGDDGNIVRLSEQHRRLTDKPWDVCEDWPIPPFLPVE